MRQRSRPITRLDVPFGRTVSVLLVLGVLGSATSARDDAQPPRDQSKAKSVTKKNYNGKVDWTVNLALG